jgi:hypothetical protein
MLMAKTQWLAQRMESFVQQVQGLGSEQEEEIARLCTMEIAAWRARPTMKVFASLKVPMTHARELLRARLAVTEHNSWLNAKTGQREHLAGAQVFKFQQ